MKRYNLTLPLEGIAGSSVQDVAADMIKAAKRFDMGVTLNMNGAHLIAFPDSTVASLRADYEAQLGRPI